MTLRTALLSVSDKTGLVDFAEALQKQWGVTLLSTGGTARALSQAGLKVRDVSDITGMPEMMDGRVKTLHPAIHGGILARRDEPGDHAAMAAHGIPAIDLVVVNLYPFEATVAADADAARCVEHIDIGGPALLRAAAKNSADVTVVSDPDDYAPVLASLERGGGATSPDLRRTLAHKAFARTAAYDALVARWLASQAPEPEAPPEHQARPGSLLPHVTLPMQRQLRLRYGENPHQEAALYITETLPGTVAAAIQRHGGALSYNNLQDLDAAWKLACAFEAEQAPVVVIVKHGNPCGVALGETLTEAYARALACDPVSAYGGIIACNRPLDTPTATAITQQFAEALMAPSFSAEALALCQQKKRLRVLDTGGVLCRAPRDWQVRSISGGYLLQTADVPIWDSAPVNKTQRLPTPQEERDMATAFTIAKHVTSNAIVLVKDGASIGIGAGQMSRVDSVRLACEKAHAAGLDVTGAALASDAFFPFDDNVHIAGRAGIRAIIQPGGSIRDASVIEAADQYGMTMRFTGMRHFRH